MKDNIRALSLPRTRTEDMHVSTTNIVTLNFIELGSLVDSGTQKQKGAGGWQIFSM
jgi:hypothetical protein